MVARDELYILVETLSDEEAATRNSRCLDRKGDRGP